MTDILNRTTRNLHIKNARNYYHNEYIWISSKPMYRVHVMYKT